MFTPTDEKNPSDCPDTAQANPARPHVDVHLPAAPKTGPGSLDFFANAVRRDLPNLKFHDYIAKKNFEHLPYSKRTDLTIATVGTAYTDMSLAQNATVIPLKSSNWLTVLNHEKGISFLLIESGYVYADADWLISVVSTFEAGTAVKDNALLSLISFCKKCEIPCIFWFQENPEQALDFLKIAQSVDHVFSTSKSAIKAFKKLEPVLQVHHLPTAIEPRLFNPLQASETGKSDVKSNFYICFDKFRELSDGYNDAPLAKLLEPALDYSFWIFESRFEMRANSARLASHFKRRFLGCFSTAGRAFIYKMSDISLQFSKTAKPTANDERHILEAIASKALVLTNMTCKDTVFEGLVVPADNPKDVAAHLHRFSSNHATSRKLRHLAYRNVMKNHTFFNRLVRICEVIGLSTAHYDLNETQTITVILPTKRPELIPFALNNFRQQTYAALELVIVLHGNGPERAAIQNLIQKDEAVRIIVMPECQSISTALNAGIALSEGTYFARMDDDDYYGPNYFSDAMLTRQYVDFDILGKAQWMVHFEATGKTVLHKGDAASHSTNPAIAGGTFLVRNNLNDRVWFYDRVQGYADVDFIGRNIVENDRVLVSSDPFNFVQIRRNDPQSHTWTIQHDKFKHNEIVCDGFDFEAFAI